MNAFEPEPPAPGAARAHGDGYLPAGPVPFNPRRPSTARVYDAMLGGKDNFAADREAAEALMRMSLAARQAARDNRAFLGRAVRWAALAGTGQFIDVGSGFPARENTHEVVRALSPARVAYVDNDPVVVAHATARLVPDGDVLAVPGDLRDPRGILGNPELRDFIDLGQPVTFILAAVLHFLPDADAYAAVGVIKEAMAPGSVLIVSHATADDARAGDAETAQGIYDEAGTPLYLRTLAQVTRFFDGLAMAGPVTSVNAWWNPGARAGGQVIGYGGVAVKLREGERITAMGPLDLIAWPGSGDDGAVSAPQDPPAGGFHPAQPGGAQRAAGQDAAAAGGLPRAEEGDGGERETPPLT
jgi:SAM-dependent methyltransferase